MAPLMSKNLESASDPIEQNTSPIGFSDHVLEKAYHSHAAYIARLVARILGRDDEVNDVVQDVFLAALRYLRQLRDPLAMRGWLRIIAIRKTMYRIRRQKMVRFFAFDPQDKINANLVRDDVDVEEQAAAAQLFKKLETLTALERTIWTLRYLEGEDLATIAEACAISDSTVKRTLRKCDEKLRGAAR